MHRNIDAEMDDEVVLEVELPFWTEPQDVDVTIDSGSIKIDVRTSYYIERTFWKDL